MKDTKKTVIKYLVTFGVALAVSILIICMSNIGSVDSMAEKYKILANAFTIPGVILACFSGLLWVASDGFFDSITYSFSRIGGMFIPMFKSKHETFYDYKQRKKDKRAEKGSESFWFLFFVGLAFILISVIFIILYENA